MEVQTENRAFPLKRPQNHKPPVPRSTLKLPKGIDLISTLYVGVQSHEQDTNGASKLETSIEEWLDEDDGRPTAVDTFRVTHGFDLADSKVWVAYWTAADGFTNKLRSLDLPKRWMELGDDRRAVGLWCEHFITPIKRLETNYSSLLHQPGISQVPGSEFPGHDLTAYWGAGRDRIPASSYDRFEKPTEARIPESAPKGVGELLTGTNYDNMCHIRSGQWWTQCDQEEREAYEDDLQKKLMGGMQYLWDHPEETGTLGLRILQNLDESGTPIRETCGAGFFRNWADLEKWSSRHPSHLAIFNGAMSHAKRFGPEKKLMTWHEVSILKAGEAKFEYVNCDPRTGVIRWVPLKTERLSM
ncbi:hypothetical protein LTR37_015448 [Vermiconidia calcicola]|uniref:Uncharacterized protein n=1 Tax=Vermiconidia calcicola TaxID=1690605 RepID=A0ACC3MRB3_9PEZI|nr:hypothetical protein LTR37_015448 [Vermiconidia calcicola]